MNLQNIKTGARRAVASATVLALSAPFAMAQTAETDLGVQAITDLSGKATTYITAAFGVAVLVAGGFWGIKMMKKAFGAAK
ncbi:major coat protein [Massilia sp. SYSU DXS3249]